VPELPEVAALARRLTETTGGQTVRRLDVVAFHALKTVDPPATAVLGQPVSGVDRLGKMLDFRLGPLHLVIHLGRGGWIRLRADVPAPSRPGRGPLALRLVLDEGAVDVTEAGTQKRLAAYLVRDVHEVPAVAALGPDALSDALTETEFGSRLGSSATQVKTALRDQRVVAGIGNAYSDEILHAAKLSPFKLTTSLSETEVGALYRATREVLKEAVERAARLPADALKDDKRTGLRVHGRGGQACPVCGSQIRDVFFADSSLQYCPTCQTGGRPLADRRLSRLLR
jgi:formamidopyrimidine-DNA glycosylase